MLYHTGMELIEVEIANHTFRGMEIRGFGSENIVKISKSLIHHNQGSGIYAYNSNLIVENTTISGNHAGDENGGGVQFSENSTYSLLLNNVTITKNSAEYGGGIATHGEVVIQNSIITNNSAYLLSTSDCDGDPISNGHNFMGNITWL